MELIVELYILDNVLHLTSIVVVCYVRPNHQICLSVGLAYETGCMERLVGEQTLNHQGVHHVHLARF